VTDTATTSAPPTQGVKVPRRWRRLALVGGSLFADNNETSVLSTLAPVIFTALALPLSALGVLVAVGKAVAVIFGPFWAYVARRSNRKLTYVITSGVAGAATVATGFSQDFLHLLLGYGITSVFVAASLPLVTEITTDLFDESSRGKASGYTWGAISLLGSVAGPLLGQLSKVDDGWRWGFFIWGGTMLLLAVLVLAFFEDPGVGASESASAEMTLEQRAENEKITWPKVRRMFAIPTFVLMLVQRLASGHLLIASFGVIFLVNTYGFTTAVAAVVTLPFGIAFMIGAFGGGIVTDALHQRFPRWGRIAVLQTAQIVFGATAIIATQFDWGGIEVFAAFWAVMGLMQGLNPGVNRPIVAAVVPPELRGAAFAVMLSVFEAAAYAIFNLVAGFMGERFGLGVVMLWVPGILMLLNGLLITVLYRTYPRDAAKMATELHARTERPVS
jgi:MFS family permease